MGESKAEKLGGSLIAQASIRACHDTCLTAKGGGGWGFGRADQELAIEEAWVRVIERHFAERLEGEEYDEN